MVTIPEIVEQIVASSPFLEEGLYRGIINYSALARQLKPEIERQLEKRVQEGAIIMALRRLSRTVKPDRAFKQIIEADNDLIVRSNLVEFVVANTDFTADRYQKLITMFDPRKKHFITVTMGIFETAIITSSEISEEVRSILGQEHIVDQLRDLSSITIRMPKENVYVPGVYYYFLKALAWEKVNMIEVVSAYTEITIILENKEIDRAFSILKRTLTPELFTQSKQ